MVKPPDTWLVPVVRTDFSDDDAWLQLQREISAPTSEGFEAAVDYVEDPTLVGVDERQLAAGFSRPYPDQYRHPVLFVADHTTLTSREHPLLVIGLNDGDVVGPFRALPATVQSIVDNLSLANMDFFEFAHAVDDDGVFRRFPRISPG